jgi:hypothetical protein
LERRQAGLFDACFVHEAVEEVANLLGLGPGRLVRRLGRAFDDRAQVCDLSTSMSNDPQDDLSAGISVLASQLPLTCLNKSSCGRVAVSKDARSMPATSAFGAVVAAGAAAGSREQPTSDMQPTTPNT